MTIEWVTLLLLIPVAIVPIVLLFGFSGCDLVFTLDEVKQVPNIVTAEALDVSTIRLAWTFDNVGPVEFEVRRTKEGETEKIPLPRTSATTIDDGGLDEGKNYTYEVVGFDDKGESPASTPKSATTFGKAFDVVLNGERPRDNRTIVQRIEPVRLFKGGNRILITIQRSTLGDLVINKLYVSKAADAAYAPASDLTAVIDTPMTIPADPSGAPFALPPVAYAVDNAQALLLAVDTGTPGNMRERSPVPATDATAFVSPLGIGDEASKPSRSPGYIVETRIYLVQRIDVV
jgi:hypothetical protein